MDHLPLATAHLLATALLQATAHLLATARPQATVYLQAMVFLLLVTAHLSDTVHLLVMDPRLDTGLPPAMAPLPPVTGSLPTGPRTPATGRWACTDRTRLARPVRCLLLQAHMDHQTLASQVQADHSLYYAVWLQV